MRTRPYIPPRGKISKSDALDYARPLHWQPPDARHVASLTARKIRRSIAEIERERDELAELTQALNDYSDIVDRRVLALSMMLTALRREAGSYEFHADTDRRAA